MNVILTLERRIARKIAADIVPPLSRYQEDALQAWLRRHYNTEEEEIYRTDNQAWTVTRVAYGNDATDAGTRIGCHATIQHAGRTNSWCGLHALDEQLDKTISTKMDALINCIEVIGEHKELARIIISEDQDDRRETDEGE